MCYFEGHELGCPFDQFTQVDGFQLGFWYADNIGEVAHELVEVIVPVYGDLEGFVGGRGGFFELDSGIEDGIDGAYRIIDFMGHLADYFSVCQFFGGEDFGS